MTRTSEPDFQTGTLNAYVIQGDEIHVDDRFGYKIIAVVWEYTWCAYKGPTGWGDDKVALNGDQVDQKIAIALFPVLAATMKTIKKSYGNY